MAITTSDSHSCAIHGAPGIECEKGSLSGTVPCSRIQRPAAMCQNVSGSESSVVGGRKPSTISTAMNATTSGHDRPPHVANMLNCGVDLWIANNLEDIGLLLVRLQFGWCKNDYVVVLALHNAYFLRRRCVTLDNNDFPTIQRRAHSKRYGRRRI